MQTGTVGAKDEQELAFEITEFGEVFRCTTPVPGTGTYRTFVRYDGTEMRRCAPGRFVV
jgi:hypothetical protein